MLMNSCVCVFTKIFCKKNKTYYVGFRWLHTQIHRIFSSLQLSWKNVFRNLRQGHAHIDAGSMCMKNIWDFLRKKAHITQGLFGMRFVIFIDVKSTVHFMKVGVTLLQIFDGFLGKHEKTAFFGGRLNFVSIFKNLSNAQQGNSVFFFEETFWCDICILFIKNHCSLFIYMVFEQFEVTRPDMLFTMTVYTMCVRIHSLRFFMKTCQRGITTCMWRSLDRGK